MDNTYLELMNSKKLELDRAVVRVNEARAAKNMDAVAEAVADCELFEAEYNGYARTKFFLECFEQENPMVYALKAYEYPTIKCIDKPNEALNRLVRSTKDSKTAINLKEMLRFAKDRSLTLGAGDSWPRMIDELATRLEVYACNEVGSPVAKKTAETALYACIQAELAKDKNALSKNKLLALLEAIVETMLGKGFKPIKADINRLMLSELKEARQGRSLNAKNSKKMLESVMGICYNCITHSGYEVKSKGADYFED